MDTIPAVLRAAAQQYADKPAYVEGDRVVSYAELLRRVEATAEYYVNAGVCCGDRVVLWGPNSIDWAVVALAVSYAGGVLIPANSRYLGTEVADIARRTDAKLIIAQNGFLGRDQHGELRTALQDAGGAGDDIQVWELSGLPDLALAHSTPDFGHEDLSPDDVADILFTSGTTGTPKGAMSAHRQSIGVARAWAELGGVTAEDRYLVVNPFFHSFGYKIGILVGLLTGATLYPVATFDVDATMALIESERITLLPGAPTIYQSILSAPGREKHDLSSLRLAVTGAAVVPVVLIERMGAPAPEGLGIDQVVTAFGMTEAVVVTMARDGDPADLVATTCGRAIPGMETRIADNGELLVRGEFVMLGYLDDPAATAEAIDADGWLHTGDIGVLDDAGNLRITDRLKDMYISGGFNVYPAEVEQELLRLDGVDDVAVIGVPDERMGEVGKAYVVGTASVDDVIAHAKTRLANFKVPRLVEHVEVLPRNPSGKVLKTALRTNDRKS